MIYHFRIVFEDSSGMLRGIYYTTKNDRWMNYVLAVGFSLSVVSFTASVYKSFKLTRS